MKQLAVHLNRGNREHYLHNRTTRMMMAAVTRTPPDI
jgi:hypothetical protein